MISDNQHIDLGSLPEHQADPDLWNRLEFELDNMEMLDDLPIHQPDNYVWKNISKQISVHSVLKRKWIIYAIALLIIALTTVTYCSNIYNTITEEDIPESQIKLPLHSKGKTINHKNKNCNEFTSLRDSSNGEKLLIDNSEHIESEKKQSNSLNRTKANKHKSDKKYNSDKKAIEQTSTSNPISSISRKSDKTKSAKEARRGNSSTELAKSTTDFSRTDSNFVALKKPNLNTEITITASAPLKQPKPVNKNSDSTVLKDSMDKRVSNLGNDHSTNQEKNNEIKNNKSEITDSTNQNHEPLIKGSLLSTTQSAKAKSKSNKPNKTLNLKLLPYAEYKKDYLDIGFNYKQNMIGLGLLINLQRNRLSIETGIGINRSYYSMQSNYNYTDIDTVSSYFYVDSIIYTYNYTKNAFDKTYVGHDRYIRDSLLVNKPAEGKGHYTTLEIPLLVGYQIYNKGISVRPKLGLIYSHVISRSEVSYSNQMDEELVQSIQKNVFLQNNGLKSYMGVHVSYPLNPNLSLWIEPSAFYHLKPLFKDANGDPIQSSGYSIKAGIEIKF